MSKHEDIMARLDHHYFESEPYFGADNIVGIWLQGSQNYELDLPESDVDTKMIVTPKFKDIALNAKPVSTTHIRPNDEHTDWKDIRLYIETFRKQNLNFLEILFTNYYSIHRDYFDQWERLMKHNEEIAHMNPWRAIKSMKGIAMEKYHAMEHHYPSREHILKTYGYDIKQLHHLVRVDNYLTRYIKGDAYADCLIPDDRMKEFLLDIKKGKWGLAAARSLAEQSLAHVIEISDAACDMLEDKENAEMRDLLEDVCYNIMKISVEKELKK